MYVPATLSGRACCKTQLLFLDCCAPRKYKMKSYFPFPLLILIFLPSHSSPLWKNSSVSTPSLHFEEISAFIFSSPHLLWLSYQMGVAILNPQDCLKNSSSHQPLPSSLPKMKVLRSHPIANPKANRSNRSLPSRPKRSPLRTHNDSHPTRSATTVKPQLNKPVMGQVKILKRGEQLTDTAAPAPAAFKQADRGKTDLGSTGQLGPTPELVPVDRVAGFYAGSSMFVASPPPSSVPLPAFFTNKAVSDATSDLRRILRLDLH